jgi:hypothetical protein
MIIDCGSCTVRGDACTDCVVTFLTVPVRAGVGPPAAHPGPPGPGAAGPEVRGSLSATELSTGREVDLDQAEQDAIEVLARSGLVPPLRLVRAG